MKFIIIGAFLFITCFSNIYASPWKAEKSDNDSIIKRDMRLPQEIEPTLPKYKQKFIFQEQYEASLFSAVNRQSLSVIDGVIRYLGFENINDIFNSDGENIITYAAKNGKIKSLKFLLLMGFNPCLLNKKGLTAKQVAMDNKDIEDDIKNKTIVTIKEMESNGRNNKNNTCAILD